LTNSPVPSLQKRGEASRATARVSCWRVFFTDSLEILYIEEVKIRNENTYLNPAITADLD
jgi:hypothetical protein